MRLRAAKPNTETGHHFIKNQHRTIGGTFCTQSIMEFLGRNDHIHVAGDWFDNHASNLTTPFCKAFFNRLWVIIRNSNRMLGKVRWHAF